MFSVATMPMFNAGADALGSAWTHDQHRPFVSSPLSSSPIRATSPASPLAERSSNIPTREIQSSPIRSSTFDKFSRYANKAPHVARHRQRQTDARESRRKVFLDKVRQRADERTYQRRDMEGTLMKSSWDRDMRERELQKQMEGDAVFSDADINDAAELLLEQEWEERTRAAAFEPMTHAEGDETMMLDAMVQQEERELDEMLMAYEEPETQQFYTNHRQSACPSFADDDEDYDALFMELVSQEGADEHGMDLS